jgi:peptide/nickel transport system substrate-binding protein
MKKLFLILLATMVSMAMILLASQPAPAATAPGSPSSVPAPKTPAKAVTPQYGGVLKIIHQSSPPNLGYPPTMDGPSAYHASPALEPIMDIDFQGRFQPTKLTTSYVIAPDGKSVTLTLRKGVKFHDGTDFNAQAAKWNLEKAIEGKIYGSATWASVDALDDYTVRLNLKQIDFTVAANLGGTSCYMISPTAFQKNGMQWALTNPVGTGPFKLRSFERDASVKFDKFTDYWQKGLPYLDGMEMLNIKDAMVASAAMQSGEAQIFWSPNAQGASDLRAKGFTVIAPYPQVLIELTPDSVNKDSALANKKVREALEHATNREAIAKAMGYGSWTALNQWCDRRWVGFNSDIAGREYNPAKARQLLSEAGYAKGFKTKIIVEQGVVETLNQDTLVAIQSQWKEVGVDLTLEPVPRAKFVEYRTKGWHDGFILGRTAVDPAYFSNILDRMFSPDGRTYTSTLRPATYGDLLAAAQASRSFESYKERVQKVVRLIYDEAAMLPLWSLLAARVTAKNVHDTGFFTVHYDYWTPDKVWLSK